MTSKAEGAGTRAIDVAGKGTIVLDHQSDAKGQGGRTDAVQVEREGDGDGH
jgi:hypothetical protein